MTTTSDPATASDPAAITGAGATAGAGTGPVPVRTAGRIRQLGSTIFSEVTALAVRHGALNLGQGFPDDDPPEAVREAAREAIAAGGNQYPPAAGLPALREAIALRHRLDHDLGYDPETEVVVCAGATEAITASVLAFCDPGDEVLLFEPYYDAYPAAVALAGGRRRTVPLRRLPDGGFGFDPDELRAAVTPRTRLLLLNSPHNPTGTVFGPEQLDRIAEVCREHDLIAVTDEVYEHLTYDGARHVPLATRPGMRERTITISSAGKTFNATGWKVGWACGPARLVAAVLRVKQYLTFAVGTPFQAAAAHGLTHAMPAVRAIRDELQRRRDLLTGALARGGIPTLPCSATYFVQLDATVLGGTDGAALSRELIHAAGVAVIPSAAFYDTPDAEARSLVRLAICKSPETLRAAADRLVRYRAGLAIPDSYFPRAEP